MLSYLCLLKMFVDSDTNKDGLVSKASFSKLIDMAASIPRMYGYAPVDIELYKTEAEKEQARQKMFDSMDHKNTGVITFDECYGFSMEHIIAIAANLAPHPILDTSNKDDGDKDGIVLMNEYPAILGLLVVTPKKLGLVHPDRNMFEENSAKKMAYFGTMFETHNSWGDSRMYSD